jgi:hypothetical protein
MKGPSLYATKSRPTIEPARTNIKQTRSRLALASALTVLYLLWHVAGLGHKSHTFPTFDHSSPPLPLPCRSLPGASETLVVFRTGSTELASRLPTHLSTSLRCFPNYLIFSDVEETYHGEHILDALADVSPNIQANNPDFDLHRRLQKGGRAALNSSELAGSPDKYAIKTGKIENEGWRLDKWKFLPMLNKTLHQHPAMKWYVFTEADGFLLSSTLHQYLATLDPTQPIYAGNPMQIGPDVFAHGGSGFVVSQPAMWKLVNYYAAHKTSIEEITENHWAGDCVLGKTFADAGVPLTYAWPSFQSDYPGLVEYTRSDARPDGQRLRVWCTTPVSYHHMSAAQVEEMWDYEQDWMVRHDPVIIENILYSLECS